MPDGDAVATHRGTRAVLRMVEYAPSTGGLALWVGHHDLSAEAEGALPASAALAATDGLRIVYRAGFEKLPVALQAGWVAHEVLHIALRHPQRYLALQRLLGEADLQLFNVCADAIVNSALGHLGWLQLPEHAVTLDRLLSSALGLSQTVEAALLEWDVERLYREIDDRRPKQPQPGRGQSSPQSSRGGGREDGPRASRARSLGGAGANDLLPGADSEGAPEDQAEDYRTWNERLVRAHAGDGAHSMLRALIADLPRTRTPWEQLLRTRLARCLAPRPALSWSRPSRSYLANQGRSGPQRRMPWEPGISPVRPVPRLVVVADVSGSIDDALVERFAREIEAITRRTEAALVLVVGDDRVRRVEHFEPGRGSLRGLSFQGGGGTDFTPLLEEADRHRPDIGVVLTDLEGPARFRPRWPVLWAVTEAHAQAQAPFGQVLVLR